MRAGRGVAVLDHRALRHHAAGGGVVGARTGDDAGGAVAVVARGVGAAHEEAAGEVGVRLLERLGDLGDHALAVVAAERLDVDRAALDAGVVHVFAGRGDRVDEDHRVVGEQHAELRRRQRRAQHRRAFAQLGDRAAHRHDAAGEPLAVRLGGEHEVPLARADVGAGEQEGARIGVDLPGVGQRAEPAHARQRAHRRHRPRVAAHDEAVGRQEVQRLRAGCDQRSAVLGQHLGVELHDVQPRSGGGGERAVVRRQAAQRIELAHHEAQLVVGRGERRPGARAGAPAGGGVGGAADGEVANLEDEFAGGRRRAFRRRARTRFALGGERGEKAQYGGAEDRSG